MLLGILVDEAFDEDVPVNYHQTHLHQQQINEQFFDSPPSKKKKRSLPLNPDPEAEVVALSPKSLVDTNRFLCEICNKGFKRDQNLQLHRRGHNLPWKLKQRSKTEALKKKVYVCPETSCAHHEPSRALGDLTGIKKHYFRKHGEKKYKCDKCSKRYAVHCDLKAHSKICGTREYRCDCGTLFSRRDSFTTHRAFCDALAEESSRSMTTQKNQLFSDSQNQNVLKRLQPHYHNQVIFNNNIHRPKQEITDSYNNFNDGNLPPWLSSPALNYNQHTVSPLFMSASSQKLEHHQQFVQEQPASNNNTDLIMSATELLRKAAQMGGAMSKALQYQSSDFVGQSSSSSSSPAAYHQHLGSQGGFGFRGWFQ